MDNFLIIDGNSIMNRAFYGIMGQKILTNREGKYTNALYGFLAILFKNIEEVNPKYILVAFDSKTGADSRKQKYEGYKKSRHAMPDELREQMPEIKEILTNMNIKVLEEADLEGDDIIGTYSKKFASDNINCYLLSGDRDLFQLIQKNIFIRIPKTKMGKTETEFYDEKRIKEEYGLEPLQLIETKALMGDSSDEIPGCKGIGEKTALKIITQFANIDNLYQKLENNEIDAKDISLKNQEKLIAEKDMVYLSKDIGTINTTAEVKADLNDFTFENWKNENVLKLFKYYGFNKFIERFGLDGSEPNPPVEEKTKEPLPTLSIDSFSTDDMKITETVEEILNKVNINIVKANEVNLNTEKLIYYIDKENYNDSENIIKKRIVGLAIYKINNIDYIKNPTVDELKAIFESETKKISYNITEDYVMLKELGIHMNNIAFDGEVALYDIDPSSIKHNIVDNSNYYLGFDMTGIDKVKDKQINLFDMAQEENYDEVKVYTYLVNKIYEKAEAKLIKEEAIELFNKIDMPLIEVLSEMQFNGIQCNKDILTEFGKELKERINQLTKEIYEIAGEEFNINSPKQLGPILFDKLQIPYPKKSKKSYSTDADILNKVKFANPIVEKILEYRTLMKLNSNYVEGLIVFINKKTNRIHSYFHQTITNTGRISSTDPNLQNIPERDEFGKNIKKAFLPKEGYVFIDADYSQVELRILAALSKDEGMIKAFNNGEDIHKEVAAQVFNKPLDMVTKDERRKAKAVNFGIVYGITPFGLSEQIGVSVQEAKHYIDSYLKKFSGVHNYMETTVDNAQRSGYVETLFNRKRYIKELLSSNFMVREFGKRASMNTPIQGTAADIMKIAMINVYHKLLESNIDGKIILQVHDELLLEVKEDQKEQAKQLLQTEMENAYKFNVPLKVEVQEGQSWYHAK